MENSSDEKVMSLVKIAGEFSITSKEDKQRAVDLYRDIKSIRLEREDFWKPHEDRIKKALDELKNEKRKEIDPLIKAEEAIKAKIDLYEPDKVQDKVEGEHKRNGVEVTIIDKKIIPREYLTINMKALEKVALAIGENLIDVPGVSFRFFKKSVIRKEKDE